MKFLKKKQESSEQKNSDAKKIAQTTQTKKVKDTQKKEKNGGLHSWIIQPVLVLVACFALCYFLIELLYLKPLDTNYQNQINQTQAKALEIDISSYFKKQAKWIDAVVKYVSVTGREATETLADVKPELKNIYFVDVGESNQPLVGSNNFSFANLDLLRRAAKEEKTNIEPFLQDGEWLFQIAKPMIIKHQDVSEKGVLLAIFTFSELTTLLKRYQHEFDGSVAVLIAGINKPIIQLGQNNHENAIILPTSLSDISLRFVPSEKSFQAADRTLVWLVLVGVSVLMIVVLMVIFRLNMNAVKSDLHRAAQMVSKAIDNDAMLTNHFHFGEVYAMANAIVTNARQAIAKYKEKSAKQLKPSPQPAVAPEDEPLFEDDLFDIDSIDSNAEQSDELFGETGALVEEQASLNVDISPSIFRAYDIRGIVDETLNPAILELLGKSIGSEALAQDQKTLCVGYDGRLSSPAYAESLITGILSTGANVICVGQVPTPVLYFATHHFETSSGVMITGSHNPSNYNGVKAVIGGNTLSGEAIQKLHDRISIQDFAVGQGERSEQSIDREYLDVILNDIAVAAPLKVVVDAGNGVSGAIAPDLIEELGCEVIPLHCEVDGNFPHHHPDPGQPENLQDLIAAVKEYDADIGLAFDGDGDRIGVVTNTGKIIWPDRLLMLFAKDVVSRNPGADIIYDVKCSRRLNGLISSYGGRPVMWKSGHSLIKAKMKETGALLAGEMSGHVFFKERWFGFDDGLYSAARLLEILGVEDKTSDEVFAEFPEDLSTPEINVAVSDEAKFSIVEKLCARKEQFVGGNVSTIDGLRVDYPNGWGLCRASNTSPALVFRFEADDDVALAEIKSKFVMHLNEIEPNLDLSF